MIFDAGLAGSKPKETPMEQNLKLTSTDFDTCTNTSKGDELLEDRGSYQRLIGKLLYLTITGHDISYAVHSLCQFMHAPKKSHCEEAFYVARKSVTGYYIKLGNSNIYWKAKKKYIISRSSAKVEYRSMAHTVVELVWLKGLLEELNMI
ncbi:uncharacterized mitochondrial protein AtMg00810-like [Nicotiana sylvestris]|uniref:uncharacterized mitochondrial protein AtMg00810-like n=1 Tax=Nicotiana sylvestris TaxID=4096 RepID=UPI00388CAD4B